MSYTSCLMWLFSTCRCHTFGIGPDVCTELVTGIAAASGGRCVLLRNTERLQTKVRYSSYPMRFSGFSWVL